MASTSVGKAVMVGDKELIRKLERLGSRVARGIERKVMTRAGRPIIRIARAYLRSHRKTGNLFRSIGLKKKTYRGEVVVGVIGARLSGKHKGQHAHLLEKGTGPRYTKRGAFRGRMPSFPFMAPAARAGIPIARSIFRTEMKKLVEEAAKKK